MLAEKICIIITFRCQQAQSFYRTKCKNKDQGLYFVSHLPVNHTRWPNKVKNKIFTWWCNCTAFLLRHFLHEKNFPCSHASKAIVTEIIRKNLTLIGTVPQWASTINIWAIRLSGIIIGNDLTPTNFAQQFYLQCHMLQEVQLLW